MVDAALNGTAQEAERAQNGDYDDAEHDGVLGHGLATLVRHARAEIHCGSFPSSNGRAGPRAREREGPHDTDP